MGTMMRSLLMNARSLGSVGLALFLLAAPASRSLAGEPPPPPTKRKPFVWTKTRDAFEYTGQREKDDERDTPRLPEDPPDNNNTHTPDPDPNPDRPGREQRMRLARIMAEQLATKAPELLAKRKYRAVLDATAAALNEIGAVHLPAPALSEKLRRMYETARRMSERAEIEKEFGGLQITIGGIAWSETTPVALINGSIMRPGDSVAGVRIEEIRRDHVVFSLKGVRVRRRSSASGN